MLTAPAKQQKPRGQSTGQSRAAGSRVWPRTHGCPARPPAPSTPASQPSSRPPSPPASQQPAEQQKSVRQLGPTKSHPPARLMVGLLLGGCCSVSWICRCGGGYRCSCSACLGPAGAAGVGATPAGGAMAPARQCWRGGRQGQGPPAHGQGLAVAPAKGCRAWWRHHHLQASKLLSC